MIDERAFVSDVASMRDMLYRLSVSYRRSDADAQDAVQQALENAWRHRERVDVSGFRPWLVRIVINECKSALRKRRRFFSTDRLYDVTQRTPPPDLVLADALERMPEKLRTPLLLHHMEGFSLEEIAAATGVPRTTVANRLFRARRALREALKEEEGSVCDAGK